MPGSVKNEDQGEAATGTDANKKSEQDMPAQKPSDEPDAQKAPEEDTSKPGLTSKPAVEEPKEKPAVSLVKPENPEKKVEEKENEAEVTETPAAETSKKTTDVSVESEPASEKVDNSVKTESKVDAADAEKDKPETDLPVDKSEENEKPAEDAPVDDKPTDAVEGWNADDDANGWDNGDQGKDGWNDGGNEDGWGDNTGDADDQAAATGWNDDDEPDEWGQPPIEVMAHDDDDDDEEDGQDDDEETESDEPEEKQAESVEEVKRKYDDVYDDPIALTLSDRLKMPARLLVKCKEGNFRCRPEIIASGSPILDDILNKMDEAKEPMVLDVGKKPIACVIAVFKSFYPGETLNIEELSITQLASLMTIITKYLPDKIDVVRDEMQNFPYRKLRKKEKEAAEEARKVQQAPQANIKPTCHSYQRGDCRFGDTCKFAHVDENANPPEPEFLVYDPENLGGYGEGVTVAPINTGGDATGAGLCFDFQKGKCERGAACRFSHQAKEEQGGDGYGGGYGGGGGNVCFDHQKGQCNRGDACKY